MKNKNTVKYRKSFEIIRTELNRVDPMGLFPEQFAPIDEYDNETEMILSKIKSETNYIVLSDIIAAVFSEMFDEAFSKEMFYNCAGNILKQLNEL